MRNPTISPLSSFLFGRVQKKFWRQAFLWLTLSLAIAALWRVFRDDVAEQDVYLVKRENVRALNPPTWVPRTFVNEAFELLPADFKSKPINSLNPSLASIVSAAFNAHPLVARVESVYVYYPARIDIKLQYRIPVALVDSTPGKQAEIDADLRRFFPDDYREQVEALKRRLAPAGPAGLEERNEEEAKETTNGDDESKTDESDEEENAPETPAGSARYVVDATGYKLPSKYFVGHSDEYRALPVILGVKTRPTTKYGPSGDPALDGAAAFADFLRESRLTQTFRIKKIYAVVSPSAGSAVYYFKTAAGAFVKWGAFETKRRVAPSAREDDFPNGEGENEKLRARRNEKASRLIDMIAASAREAAERSEGADSTPSLIYDVSDI